MPEILKDPKISQNEFYGLANDFVLDMIAFYAALQDDVLGLLEKAKTEGWSPDRLITEVEKLI